MAREPEREQIRDLDPYLEYAFDPAQTGGLTEVFTGLGETDHTVLATAIAAVQRGQNRQVEQVHDQVASWLGIPVPILDGSSHGPGYVDVLSVRPAPAAIVRHNKHVGYTITDYVASAYTLSPIRGVGGIAASALDKVTGRGKNPTAGYLAVQRSASKMLGSNGTKILPNLPLQMYTKAVTSLQHKMRRDTVRGSTAAGLLGGYEYMWERSGRPNNFLIAITGIRKARERSAAIVRDQVIKAGMPENMRQLEEVSELHRTIGEMSLRVVRSQMQIALRGARRKSE
jgi:hypothetical protein